MVKILQTGDLHLGKTLYEYSLEEDQKHMLHLLIEELQKYDYDILLITGDIYDRSIPSQEAVLLFDTFLTTIHTQFPNLQVGIISGNHDSAARLSYASSFLRNLNIHITTQPDDCDKPIIIHSKDGDTIALYQIPFLYAGTLRNEKGELLKTQEELLQEAISRIKKTHSTVQNSNDDYKNLHAIINTHLFTLAGQESDSERLLLGTAEMINPTIFEEFAFTAIGHLHKKQKVTDNAFYAGSPLSYSFSEINTEKCFLRIELDTKNEENPHITEVPIVPLRKLVQIETAFDEFEKMTEQKNNFIEFTYTDVVIIENAAARLRKKFPYLLSVKQKQKTGTKTEIDLAEKRTLFEKKESLNMANIISLFLDDIGEAKQQETIELFETIAHEIQGDINETT